MRMILTIKFLVCFFISLMLRAQELPPIGVYMPKTYGADNQNWAISQSEDKLIYVANNKGLLEFNGEDWKLYDSPNGKMRCVKVIDSLIYTGSYREFGYWKKNQFNVLKYTSLSDKLKIEFLEDEDFWNIIPLENWILFQSLKRIYIYNKTTQSYSIINSESGIYKMFKANETIYYQVVKKGLFKIEKGVAKLVSDHKVFKENYLVDIFANDKDDDHELMVVTEESGFYILSEKKGLNKWNIPENEVIEQISVFRSLKLSDGSIYLGTRSDGVFHLTPDGEVDNFVNFFYGLSSNSIHDVFEDINGNIWFATDNGISCVNINSPFSIYFDKEGDIGTIYASVIHNGYLYLGTNQGLFSKPFNSREAFSFVDGTEGPVRCLVVFNGTLFCGHNLGTFIINKNQIEKKIDSNGTWNIISVKGDDNLLLQGNYDGFSVLVKIDEEWVYRNKIQGFDISSRYFEILEDEIFVSHEYKGVYRIKVDQSFTKVLTVVKDSSINKGMYSSLVKHNNRILYAYKDGVFYYDTLNKEFVRDTLGSQLFNKEEYISGKLLSDSKNNILWSFSRRQLKYISPGRLSSNPIILSIPISNALPLGLTGYENIYPINNRQYLIGTSTGYLVMDLDKYEETNHEIFISSITTNNLKLNDFKFVDDINLHGDFEYSYNNLEFNFCVPEYKKFQDTEYQYKLEGYYSNWSNWSSNSNILFKNLSYGDYTFKVRARVGNNMTSNISSYSFTIGKPWYASNLVIAGYLIIVLLFSFMMHNIYKTYYKKQREKLIQKTARELEMKKLENRQQLMRFNNDKLRQDIENKNRELGISTMSLIKKNEFLNSIKKELQNSEGGNNLKQVIKIIDKNLNNTDDWNLFQEAFNNADKDFLKKVKSFHPDLTNNDLRLCAYLRLNLSSKEIAPLLNISARSVEVKRYRLRKKMNLPHESSLTDYILEM